MKLRNNKTGEIIDIKDALRDSDDYPNYYTVSSDWEEVPEGPKEYWYIDWNGEVCQSDIHDEKTEQMKLIGNYFETEEEAEKAAKRLRALTRLKDDGCKPIMWRWKQDYPNDACYVEVVLKCQFDSGVHDKELDLLFGGKE